MAAERDRPDSLPQGGVATARIGADRYHTDISIPAEHRLVADEPAYAGGGGDGPAPIDLMVAALASCKAVTIRMQADRHGWPLTSATVTARHSRVDARTLGDGSRGAVDIIDCEISLKGRELTAQQRGKLLKLADNCWVQHALKHPTRITSRLAEDG